MWGFPGTARVVKAAWGILGLNDPRDATTTLLIFCGILLVVRALQWLSLQRRLPPGPWGLPIVGCLPFIKGDLHLEFAALAAKYGPIFSIRLGTQLIVVASDPNYIRQILCGPNFINRPKTEFMRLVANYGKLRRLS